MPELDGTYEVSTWGRVRNAKTHRVLAPFGAGQGYLAFRPGHGAPNFYVHRAVALAFLGPSPSPRHQVAHGDGNRQNNALKNLRWATVAENLADRGLHGTARNGRRFISEVKELEILDALHWKDLLGLSEAAVGRWLGVSRETVAMVRRHGARLPARSL